MANTPRWQGSKAIHLQPGFPKFFSSGDNEGWRLEYRGPFVKLLAERPARGVVVAGYAGYYVEDVLVEPDGAGKSGPGTMRITVASEISGGTATAEEETVIEIDAGSIEKPLLQFSKFIGVTTAEAKAVREAIEAGETIPGPRLPGPLEEPVTELYEHLKKGQESYLIAAPVVRKTTSSYAKPTVGAIGLGTRTTAKPDPDAPEGYEWIKSADRASRTGRKGKWSRVQEWLGADEWSEYIYGPAAP